MSLYNSLARRVMAPALDLVRGCHCMSSLAELEKSQWWSPDRLEALQQERLAQTIRHAYAHVPYYRQVMQEHGLGADDVRTTGELVKLPIVTKAIIRERRNDMVAGNVPAKDLVPSRTSGSTGSPLVFLTTKHDRYSYGRARGLLAMEWAGVTLGDRTATFASTFGVPTRLEKAIGPVSARFRRAIVLPPLSSASLEDVVRLLHRARPHALAAYPSALALIAGHIRDSKQKAPRLHAILTGGEQMFDHQRALIRDVFGLEPFERYGSRENYVLAAECEAHSGLHVYVQDLVLEVVDDDGAPVPPGSVGRIIITNLHARGMPFIRYDTGDLGSYAPAPCPCGRGMPLLDIHSGRRCDTIYTRSGGRFPGTSIGISRFGLLGVSQFQMVQEDLDHLLVRAIVHGASTPESVASVKQGIESVLRHNVGADIAIDVELVDHIEPSAAGKYVPVISKVDPNSCLKRAEG